VVWLRPEVVVAKVATRPDAMNGLWLEHAIERRRARRFNRSRTMSAGRTALEQVVGAQMPSSAIQVWKLCG
jgi:hypothetical protein